MGKKQLQEGEQYRHEWGQQQRPIARECAGALSDPELCMWSPPPPHSPPHSQPHSLLHLSDPERPIARECDGALSGPEWSSLAISLATGDFTGDFTALDPTT